MFLSPRSYINYTPNSLVFRKGHDRSIVFNDRTKFSDELDFLLYNDGYSKFGKGDDSEPKLRSYTDISYGFVEGSQKNKLFNFELFSHSYIFPHGDVNFKHCLWELAHKHEC